MGFIKDIGEIAAIAAIEKAKEFSDKKGFPSVFDILLNKKDIDKIIKQSKYDDFLIIRRKKTDEAGFINPIKFNKYSFYISDINDKRRMIVRYNQPLGNFLSIYDNDGKLIGEVTKSGASHGLMKAKPKGLNFTINNERICHMDSYIPRIKSEYREYIFNNGLKAEVGYSNVKIKNKKNKIAKIYFARDDINNQDDDQFIMGYYKSDKYDDILLIMIFATVTILENLDEKRRYKKDRILSGV